MCMNQLGDVQLAIAVARVYGGDDGPVLREILQERVLPQAAKDGNRWLATWAFWMLGRRDQAVRALMVSGARSQVPLHAHIQPQAPIHTLLDTPSLPDLEANSFLTDDPGLVVFYRQLRQNSVQTLRGASSISPREEWEFVIRNARLYDRMGCDLLALDLGEFRRERTLFDADTGPVRNWEFLRQPPETNTNLNDNPDPKKMLERRSSTVVTELPSAQLPRGMKSGGITAPPQIFQEPDTNSLLDSFGF